MNRLPSILLVDDDVTIIAALRSILAERAQLRFATSGTDALRMAALQIPDLVLLDIEMPGMGGFEVCAAFKRDERLKDIPIVFITSHSDPEQEAKGLSLGAADFITKPPSPPRVLARVQTQLRIKEMADQMRLIATTDALTQVANRRRFDEVLTVEWARSVRHRTPLTLLLIDIDHFKNYNDRYGHMEGDKCLASTAEGLRRALLRPGDLLARYGGEEFAAILPDTPKQGACTVASRLFAAIEDLHSSDSTASLIEPVSVSIGISTFDHRNDKPGDHANAWSRIESLGLSPERFIAAADQALYSAKRRGRKQVCYLDAHDCDHSDRIECVANPLVEAQPPRVRSGGIT